MRYDQGGDCSPAPSYSPLPVSASALILRSHLSTQQPEGALKTSWALLLPYLRPAHSALLPLFQKRVHNAARTPWLYNASTSTSNCWDYIFPSFCALQSLQSLLPLASVTMHKCPVSALSPELPQLHFPWHTL